MDRLLAIFRHGDTGTHDDDPLSRFGTDQIQKLSRTISILILEGAEAIGEKIVPIFFSFSTLKRAVESIQMLRWSRKRDIVITSAGEANRKDIKEPHEILSRVTRLMDCYNANMAVIIAHGEMPAVIAETAHELATGQKLAENLEYPGKAHGFVVNLTTGEVFPLGWNSLESKNAPPAIIRDARVPPAAEPAKPLSVVAESAEKLHSEQQGIAVAESAVNKPSGRKRRTSARSPTGDLFSGNEGEGR